MLHTDDAGCVSWSPSDLTNMMVIILEVCAAFGLTVLEKKTETMSMPEPHMTAQKLRITAADQACPQIHEFVYL